MIKLTDFQTGCETIIYPELFIIHKPQRVQIDIGKPVFHQTAVMSVMSPEMVTQVREDYEDIKKLVHLETHNFIEITHGQTGTKFLICPKYFQFVESHDEIGKSGKPSVLPNLMVSLWNPLMTVPIKEPWREIVEKLGELECITK